jgi:hypothetical protein
MKSFKNYIKNRKIEEAQLSGKPKTKLVADYDGPIENKPDQGKNSTPYKHANSSEKPKKGENGFGNMGCKSLVYEPDLKGGNSKLTSLGKEVGKDWKKVKSEAWFEKTSKMNNGEFIKFMNECSCESTKNLPTITAQHAGKFHPYPPEVINYLAALGNKNPKIIDDLVHEVKRSGGLNNLVKALFDHQESYDKFTELLNDEGDGPKRCRSFAKSMNGLYKNEAVGPPIGMDDEELNFDAQDDESDYPPDGDDEGIALDDEMSDDDENMHHNMEDEDDFSDEDMDSMEDEDDMDNMDDEGDDGSMEDDFSDEDMDSMEDGEDMDNMGNEEDFDDNKDDFGNDLNTDDKFKFDKRIQKESFKHKNLMNTISNFEPIMKSIRRKE